MTPAQLDTLTEMQKLSYISAAVRALVAAAAALEGEMSVEDLGDVVKSMVARKLAAA